MILDSRKHSPAIDAQFIALWEAGRSINDIARELRIAKSTACNWRDRLGLTERFVSQEPDPDKVRICELWKEGRSATEIARIFNDGRTRNAIIGVVYRAGLTGTDRGSAKPNLRPSRSNIGRFQATFTEAMDAELRKMASEGISRAMAGRRMQVSESRIRDRIKALDLHWTNPRSAADSPWQKKAKPKQADIERAAATIAGQAILAAATDEPGPEAVRMIERRVFGQCAWPVGEATGADQLCCGKPIPDGASGVRQSYCAGHGMRAVSRTFVRAPIVHQDRSVAAAPRRTPSNDDHLWDVAA
jgi:hypothetical protein